MVPAKYGREPFRQRHPGRGIKKAAAAAAAFLSFSLVHEQVPQDNHCGARNAKETGNQSTDHVDRYRKTNQPANQIKNPQDNGTYDAVIEYLYGQTQEQNQQCQDNDRYHDQRDTA